jgi:2-polyprenyl-3-methyl-5-hydroxy-6-metoxy-1,4-benzoquinol methylase
MWPDVKKEVPEAELRIFYGWDIFARFYADNPERMAWKDKIDNLMRQPGVTHLGRISHEACVKEHESAGIWTYPTHFGEISCITAMRAQVYGSIPVVINYAALTETVQHGIRIDGDIYDPETREKYTRELVALLKDEKRQEEIREPMMKWAREKFAWSGVAKQWSDEFKGSELENKIEELMDNNQALKAWDLVKDTDSPLKDRVWLKVKHAFEPEEFKKYYTESVKDEQFSEEVALNINKHVYRYAWLYGRLMENKPKTMVDLGSADGSFCLTMAKEGIKTTGINLYKTSVDFANNRATKNRLSAKFICEDLFDHKIGPKGHYDVVIMTEVLEHLPDPQKGVDKAMSLITKDGRAYFSTPRTDHVGVEMHKQEVGRKSWDDGKPSGHLRLFTEEEFRKLFEKYKITDFFLDGERCMDVEVRLK